METVPHVRISMAEVGPAVLRRFSWVLLAVWGASSIRSLVGLIPSYKVTRYMGPWYYVDYSDGFIRRGLPGEVLRLTWGASRLSVEIFGWALSFAAVLAVLVIAWRIVSLGVDPTVRLVTATLVLIAPLGITSIIRDPGRQDTIGMMALAAMLLVAMRGKPSPTLVVAVTTLGTAIAVASEEFLLAFVAPAAAALLYTTVRSRSPNGDAKLTRRYAELVTLSLLPATGLALASLVVRASPSYLDAVQNRSHDPGVSVGPIYALRWSVSKMVDWTFSTREAATIIATTAIWLLIYLVTIVAVRIVLGRFGAWYWISAAYFALVPMMGSIPAIDSRRWWTLSLLGHFAVVAILSPALRAPRRESSAVFRRLAPYAVPLALVISIYGQSLPNTVRSPADGWGGLSKYIGPGYAKDFVPFWLEGREQP